jgi:hypothetical protein
MYACIGLAVFNSTKALIHLSPACGLLSYTPLQVLAFLSGPVHVLKRYKDINFLVWYMGLGAMVPNRSRHLVLAAGLQLSLPLRQFVVRRKKWTTYLPILTATDKRRRKRQLGSAGAASTHRSRWTAGVAVLNLLRQTRYP